MSYSERERMVREDLYGRGIRDPRVLDAMLRVPRERFVEARDDRQAYADRALPIACGQTISQPYMVALMTQVLRLTGNEHVLEIGTGSGYQTAILAELAREVTTIERFEELSRQAAQRLADLGYDNIHFYIGDGSLGVPERAPYDRILVTAAAPDVPPALWEQLAEGGILVGPFGVGDEQWLEEIRKHQGRPVRTSLVSCRFVPFVMSGEPVRLIGSDRDAAEEDRP